LSDTLGLRDGAVTNRLHIARLVWDDWNRNHITKHAVAPSEVYEVVAGTPMVRETYKLRLQIIGPTLAGRMLSIVVGSVPGQLDSYYVFSARPASRQERRSYLEFQGELG
jgi:uncharacterized DUF497 family protein